MEENPTRICELLIGLGDVEVLGVDDAPCEPLGVDIRSGAPRPACGGCGGSVWSKGAAVVQLVDLAAFGRPVRLVWHKWRWWCPAASCVVASFTEVDNRIAPARGALTAVMSPPRGSTHCRSSLSTSPFRSARGGVLWRALGADVVPGPPPDVRRE